MLLLLMPLGRILSLPLAGGSFSVSGGSASADLTFPLGCGVMSLVGAPAQLTKTWARSSGCGVMSLVGDPAQLTKTWARSSGCGMFALTGEAIVFTIGSAGAVATVARFAWKAQAITTIVPAPAHARFDWKV